MRLMFAIRPVAVRDVQIIPSITFWMPWKSKTKMIDGQFWLHNFLKPAEYFFFIRKRKKNFEPNIAV